MKRNERGFPVYGEFMDTYGSTVSVTQSSLATANRCWVQIHRKDGYHEGSQVSEQHGMAHLNRRQAKQLVASLQRWLKEE
jgi:hypothetical protein